MGRNKKLFLAFVFVVLIAAVVAALLLTHKGAQKEQAKTSTSKSQSVPLTARGQPVPEKFRIKAEKLGYYCPSWNAQPGQIASAICYPLDKH